jgi:chromosome segregation ATPase
MRPVLTQFLGELTAAQKELVRKEGNIKKLSVVPCGTSFPSCHYIKDAHEDQATIQKQKLLVDEESQAYETQKALVESLKKENAEKLLEEIKQKKGRLQQIEMEQVRVEAAISKTNSEISAQEIKLTSLKEELKQVQSVLNNQEDLDEDCQGTGVRTECKVCEDELKKLWLQLGAATNNGTCQTGYLR